MGMRDMIGLNASAKKFLILAFRPASPPVNNRAGSGRSADIKLVLLFRSLGL